MIIIVDTESANLYSLQNAIRKVGFQAVITRDPGLIVQATRIFLPGVGAFKPVMNRLSKNGVADAIVERVTSGNSQILGICLGMQLLADSSDEGGFTEGLGLISGKSRLLESTKEHPVPHVGFNNVSLISKSKLFEGIPTDSYFYFTHSFALSAESHSTASGITTAGNEFISAIDNRKGVMGVQFHPEKSKIQGLAVIKNFIREANA
jgi:glutamine amidotransferase